MTTSHTARKAKRQSIREFAAKVTAPHTTLARSGFDDEVRDLLQQAYRIGLNNGKLLARKSDGKESQKCIPLSKYTLHETDMEKNPDSTKPIEAFEEFVRQVYLALNSRGLLSQLPKRFEHNTVYGIVPFDASKHTVCFHYVEQYAIGARTLYGRLEFDTEEQAKAFSIECRARGQTGTTVIYPAEAADFNTRLRAS